MDNEERKRSRDEQERKHSSTTTPGCSEQPHLVLSIEMASEEEEREAITSLARMESESDEEEEDDEYEEEDSSSDENNDYDYEYFESQGSVPEGNLIFFQGHESQDSNSAGEDMEEDDIDPDDLSYEELIALGEVIGQEKRGLPLEEISKCLKPFEFQHNNDNNLERREVGIDLCVICQVEFEVGELLVTLPCDHPYHSECVTKWVEIKKICPICSSDVSPPPKICKA